MKLQTLKPRIATLDTRRVKPPPKQADRELLTAQWREMRDRVRREARGMCQSPGCIKRGVYVDHIVERKDGGAVLDRANLQLLCPSHHVLKGNIERAKRMAKRY